MRTFVGFGFGPIQAGLFLAEAHLSGNFDRLVVAEVVPEVVVAVRAAAAFTVNVGRDDGIDTLTVRPVEIYSPRVDDDRARLIAAVAEATEMATALPSVDFYGAGGASSVAQILAGGLLRKVEQSGPPAVVYAAENHTQAAELLRDAVLAVVPPERQDDVLAKVQFLDTIIGKMSGAPEEAADLQPLAPGLDRAYLVEAFNRIYISHIRRPDDGGDVAPEWADFVRGIEVFVEKADLAPFAEAKLYGHNAGHALAAYLAHALGFRRIDELRGRPDVIDFVRAAMVEESGAALCARYAGVDPLFTPAGFADYAGDLIRRMVNPYVRDTVARVGRDPARKLGWNDRLVGAMRQAQEAGIAPRRYALGAAAALAYAGVDGAEVAAYLAARWAADAPDDEEAQGILALVLAGLERLQSWAGQNYPLLV